MDRIHRLKEKIDVLYLSRNPSREEWADWLHATHIYVASDNAKRIAEQHGANVEYAMAGAMLHDIADAVMSRFDSGHEERSLEIARELLRESDFSSEEVAVIVDDAIRFHGCRNGELPKTLEGMVVATSDALAHLKTDFYPGAFERKIVEGETRDEIRMWVLPKLERDFRIKIFFEDIRNEAEPYYKKLKEVAEAL